MQTQAYFENIQQQIIQEIAYAKHSVLVAVAWLTDSRIFSELCSKADSGVKVELLLVNDTINNDLAPFDHNRLETCGGRVYFVSQQDDGSIMHHKFCIIDDCTVITGSYNWSRKAQLNDENIVVTKDACELGAQFKKEFDSIKRRFSGDDDEAIVIDYAKIIKRFELIKNFACLDERDEINVQTKKLREQPIPAEVITILQTLEREQYIDALTLIEEFIKAKNQISLYDDAEIFGMQLEIQSLVIQLNALENEFVEAEKMVHEFLVRHTKELGSLIIALLELRKDTAKTDEEKADAEQDEKNYREGYNENKDVIIPELTVDEKQKLTKLYREASMLCHPDKFANETQEKQKLAEELFSELAEAYNYNDSNRVKAILANLKNGILKTDPAHSVSKKAILKTRLESFRSKAMRLAKKIKDIKQTEAYVTATSRSDWDEYFDDAKRNLEQQIENLKREVYE